MIEVLERRYIQDEGAIYTLSEVLRGCEDNEDEQGEAFERIDNLIIGYFNEDGDAKQDVWQILLGIFASCDAVDQRLDVKNKQVLYEEHVSENYTISRDIIDMMTISQLAYYFSNNETIQREYLKEIFYCLKETYEGETIEYIVENFQKDVLSALIYDKNGKQVRGKQL